MTKGHINFFIAGSCVVLMGWIVLMILFPEIVFINTDEPKEFVTDSCETDFSVSTSDFDTQAEYKPAPKTKSLKTAEIEREGITEETTAETETTETIEETTIIEEETTNYPKLAGNAATYEPAFSQLDIELMALCVYHEARGECYEGQVAVAEVIINRVLSPNFPNTVADVIYQPGQFACASYLHNAIPTETQYSAVWDAINAEGVLLNSKCVYFSIGTSCGSYYTTIGNHTFGLE